MVTYVLVVVDRFSKSCRLLPLKGLPTAMETAELMFNHIFRWMNEWIALLSLQAEQTTKFLKHLCGVKTQNTKTYKYNIMIEIRQVLS